MAASVTALDDRSLQMSLAAERFALLGCAFDVTSQSERYRSAPYAEVSNLISAAMVHQQIKCYFNTMGRPVGLLLWAWVTEDVLARIDREREFPPRLHPSEWQEGDIALVVDLVALPHTYTFRSIVREARRLFQGERKVAWIDSHTRSVRFIERVASGE